MAFFSTNDPAQAPDAIPTDLAEAANFVSDRLRKRELSRIVRDLNADVLTGTPAQRDAAFQALERMGFVKAGS